VRKHLSRLAPLSDAFFDLILQFILFRHDCGKLGLCKDLGLFFYDALELYDFIEFVF